LKVNIFIAFIAVPCIVLYLIGPVLYSLIHGGGVLVGCRKHVIADVCVFDDVFHIYNLLYMLCGSVMCGLWVGTVLLFVVGRGVNLVIRH